MPLTRLTRQELVDRAAGQIESRLGDVNARLRRNMVQVFAVALGLAEDGLYAYLDTIARELFADRSDPDFLLRDASLYGLAPEPPTAASFPVALTGTGGAQVPQGAVLVRSDGTQFVTSTPVTLGSATMVTVSAVVPGAAGTTAPGTTLQFQNPVAGVLSAALVEAGGIAGTDTEATEDFRARLLARKRAIPQGGNGNDYVNWAKSVPGVTRAWTFPRWQGAGTVGVSFVFDDRPVIIPTANDVAEVQSVINNLRPIRGAAIVFAPTPSPLNPVIRLTPSNATTQAAVTAQLADLIAREASPGGLLYLTHIADAIGTAPGVVDYQLVSPTANLSPGPGQMTVMGTVTWM
ncbi:MAG TPA: baseplate J/gp47 family protein [Stellaceae bacterium]|nr:baseplate J/gp47 family protein [Stellaceae bacterium]